MAEFLPGLTPFTTWLAASPVSQGIGERAWITPSVQSLHIMAIAVVMSGMLMIDLRLLRVVGKDQSVQSYTQRYLPWVWWSILILFLSGSSLIVGEPRRSLQSAVFALKMGLLIAGAALALIVQISAGKNASFWETPGRRALAKLIAAASMLIWMCIIFAGRWIAYAQG